MTLRLILALLPLTSAAQTLFDLAPDNSGSEFLPNVVHIREASLTPRNFFFGDSLSDTGNIFDVFGTLGPGYPGTTFSNGPTWVGYLEPDIARLSESVIGTPDSPALDLSRSLDLSSGGATTAVVLSQQVEALFVPFATSLAPGPNDRAFLWAGGNDFLPVLSSDSPVDFTPTISTALSNLTQSVSSLDSTGLPHITVISQINLGLSPRIQNTTGTSAAIINSFNSQLRNSLQNLPTSANLLWIDSDSFINEVVSNPAAFGFTNVTEAAAPLAGDGIPSALTAEEQAGYLFYDDIHPTTTAHQQFALYVSEHLSLDRDALDLSLVTDSALILDDRFGFDSPALRTGEVEMNVSTFISGNQIGRRRQTAGVKGDYDYALTETLLVGAEFFYSDGDTGRSNFEAMGAGLDVISRHTSQNLQWEAGLGAGLIWGDLDRTYQTPGFEATSDQRASTLTAHAAIRNQDWAIGNLKASWEIGIKQRLVRRTSSAESGAASLNLAYQSGTLTSTLANLELSLAFTPKLELQLALNPVLFHNGGEISANQRDGLAKFTTSDLSGFDLHTARASLLYQTSPSSAVRSDFIIGSDKLWSANLSLQLRF